MSRVAKSVVISNTPDRIMEYIADVRNHPAFIGPLKGVSNLGGDAKRAGTSWDWTFIMAGIELTGKAETLEYVPGQRFRYRTTTGAESTFTYSAAAEGAGTKVTVDVTYDVPKTIAGKLQAAVVEKWNDAEGTRAVENLKAILDT
jgi:uncharacterized membrane protein